MKKISIFVGTICSALFLSGCSSNEMLTCTGSTTANGITTTTTYEIEYNDNDVKHLKMTYDYVSDTSVDGVGTGTDGSAVDNDTNNNNNNNNNNDTAGNVGTSSVDDNDIDGDDIVDGAVGDAIDTTIGAITDTILDISGIRDTYNNQVNAYGNITGFTSTVDVDNDNEYKIVYEIDMDTISDNDLTRFNVDRDLSTLRDMYEAQGLTCK